eukprot:scaffold34135_cov183-Skeletonema_dohrnii-CCMP3373.AAC.2
MLNKCLSREKDASMLSRPTLMGHQKLLIAIFIACDSIWPSTEKLAAVSNWTSSGHLRRCSDADTLNKCLSRKKDASMLSRPTVMGH